jgi:hypothetical protein
MKIIPSLKAKVKVILRPTVIRAVRLGIMRPSETRDQFFFLLEILFRQLRVCYFVAHSLTRGRVCNLLLLLRFARWSDYPTKKQQRTATNTAKLSKNCAKPLNERDRGDWPLE